MSETTLSETALNGSGQAAEAALRQGIADGSLREIEVAWSDPFGHSAGKRIPAGQFLERATGTGFAFCEAALGWNTDFLPALPVGLMKILSGSGARGLMVDVMQTHGVESFAGRLAAIIQGSTETTFYVLAVYFGSVGVKDTRHALGCALFADAVGIVAAIGVAYAFYR